MPAERPASKNPAWAVGQCPPRDLIPKNPVVAVALAAAAAASLGNEDNSQSDDDSSAYRARCCKWVPVVLDMASRRQQY